MVEVILLDHPGMYSGLEDNPVSPESFNIISIENKLLNGRITIEMRSLSLAQISQLLHPILLYLNLALPPFPSLYLVQLTVISKLFSFRNTRSQYAIKHTTGSDTVMYMMKALMARGALWSANSLLSYTTIPYSEG